MSNSNPNKDKLNPAQIEREYGFAYNFFKHDQELWGLLNKAVNNSWSAGQFQAHLQNTKWFQKHSDIFRQTYALKYSDPGTYQERLGNYVTQVQNIAGHWGVDLTKHELSTYAERAMMLGWSQDQITDIVAKQVRPNAQGNFDGSLAGVQQQLDKIAFDNGVRIPKGTQTQWMRAIVRGDADVAQYEANIRGIAAKTFAAYGKDIQSGMNAVDVAAPYIQSMSQILELNPAEVNMFDPTIRRALSYRDPKTKEPSPMSITDFEDSLRADRRWQYTDQAREQMKGYANELGKMWGLI